MSKEEVGIKLYDSLSAEPFPIVAGERKTQVAKGASREIGVGDGLRIPEWDMGDQRLARGALVECDDACLTGADDQIGLPVTEAFAVLDNLEGAARSRPGWG